MGQSNGNAAETVRQFGFMIRFEGSYPITFIDHSNKVSILELNISGVEPYNHKGGVQKNVMAVVEELLKMCNIPSRDIRHFLLTRYKHSTRRYRPG